MTSRDSLPNGFTARSRSRCLDGGCDGAAENPDQFQVVRLKLDGGALADEIQPQQPRGQVVVFFHTAFYSLLPVCGMFYLLLAAGVLLYMNFGKLQRSRDEKIRLNSAGG
jgi:hypothetical protein